MNTIRLGEKEYPYHINWRTFENWEIETGKEMQDLLDILGKYKDAKKMPSGKDVMPIIKFAFFAVQLGLKRTGGEPIDMDDFIDNSEITDLGKYMTVIASGLDLKIEEDKKGNKRQPKQSV